MHTKFTFTCEISEHEVYIHVFEEMMIRRFNRIVATSKKESKRNRLSQYQKYNWKETSPPTKVQKCLN